jgi:hypothetical protein
MKKFFITMILFAGMAGNTIFAAGSGGPGNPRVEETLKKEFSGAQSVHWEYLKKGGLYHAMFIYNNERMNAYISPEGELIATGRFIPLANLPFLAAREISTRYQDYRINEIIEFTRDGETGYLVDMENESKKLSVQVTANGGSSVYKKEKKNFSKAEKKNLVKGM